MIETKHTPGPWCVEDPMDFELTIVEAGKPTYEWRFIASCSLPEGDDDQDFTRGEVQANARLIAAAPELLGALNEMIGAYWRGSEDSDDAHAPFAVQLALATIAKATGAE